MVPVVIPELEGCRIGHSVTVGCEATHNFRHVLRTPRLRRQLGLGIRVTFASVSQFTASDYIQAQRLRRRTARHFSAAFGKCDVLAVPTVPQTAPERAAGALRGGESNITLTASLMKYVSLANFVGAPAVAVPVGVDADGLPCSCATPPCLRILFPSPVPVTCPVHVSPHHLSLIHI